MKKIICSLLVFFSISAHADSMKDLFVEALKNGSSEGVMTDNIEPVFKKTTKSNEPIRVKITRIKQYKQDCGRLHVEIKQDGVKATNGDLITLDQSFEINICPDGKPPAEKIQEMEIKQAAMIHACKVSIEKYAQDKDTGATKAFIRASGCPESGMSHWRYTGECDTLKMPENMATKTPISKEGKVSIELRIPMQCLSTKNSWSALIENNEGYKIGDVKADW